MNKLVSIMLSVQQALDDMDKNDTEEIPVLLEWAIKGDRKIGSPYDYTKKIFILDVKECRAKLPAGTVEIKGMLMGDHGCSCDTVFDRLPSLSGTIDNAIKIRFAEAGFISIDVGGDNVISCFPPSYEIQDNQIVFNGKVKEGKITVQALIYPIDCDGLPLINENNVDAVSAYIKFMYAQRSIFTNKPMYGNTISFFEERWHKLCADARATSGKPNPAERAEIISVLQNPLTGNIGGIQLTHP